MRIVFVHGACVRDGAWWWARAAALLAADGVESVAVRLPSCGETGGGTPGTGGPGLAEDVAEVRRVLRGGGPAVLVGHSYGGIVSTAAADGVAEAAHLVYISSFLLEAGEALAAVGGRSEPAPYLDFAADGTFGVRPEVTRELFLHDCDAEAVDGALARLARQTAAVTTEPLPAATWRRLPTTYLVCAEDRATPPDLQRAHAARASRVRELPTGHHPFLSRPDLVVAEVRQASS
jgi:pimeloyl-ACP methyl ester carboxylesterase